MANLKLNKEESVNSGNAGSIPNLENVTPNNSSVSISSTNSANTESNNAESGKRKLFQNKKANIALGITFGIFVVFFIVAYIWIATL